MYGFPFSNMNRSHVTFSQNSTDFVAEDMLISYYGYTIGLFVL